MERLKMKKHLYPGKLISFCGLDGCGKTTMIALLSEYLKGKGYSVELTKQPTPYMRQTEIFRNFMDCPNHEQYEYRSLSLMAASDRIQHTVKFIEPLLKEGKLVISDRYFYSCLANLRARGYEQDRWIYEIAEHIVEPDLALFLDIDVATAVSRVRSRKEEKERYIDMDLQHRLHQEYLDIAELNQYPVFDSGKEAKETFVQIKKQVDKILGDSEETLTDKRIEDFIRKFSAVQIDALKDETPLCELGYDSFARTQLILSLEEEQGFEFPLEKLHPDNFVTVSAVKETVKNVIRNAEK